MLKHLTGTNITYLCNCLSDACVQHAENTREIQTSFKLGYLTTCNKWFRSREEHSLKNFDESFSRLLHIVIDLVQTDADPFVLYAARQALVALLEHPSHKVEVKKCFHGVLDCLGKKEIGTLNKNTILEVTSDLLQGELAITILDVVKQTFPWLTEILLRLPFQNDNLILLTTFIILWRKSAKKCQDLQLDLHWVMDFENLQQTVHRISVTEKHLYSRHVIHLFKTFYSYGQSLCLKTSLEPIYVKLGTAIIQWALGRGICNLYDETASGFGGTLVFVSCKSQMKPEFGNLSSLRQLAALLLSVAATIIRFSQDTVNLALPDLSKCLLQLNDHATVTVHGCDHRGESFDWMTTVFGDQDDTLMEAFLEVLDIYCITNKRSETFRPYLEKLITTINPHRQFYQLLQMTSFDHSVLVDLLTSPETCALLYLTRYLKCVINEWGSFVETLDCLGNTDYTCKHLDRKWDPENCLTQNRGSDFMKNSWEDVTKSTMESQKTNSDERKNVEEEKIASSIQDNQSTDYQTEIKCKCPKSQFVIDSKLLVKTSQGEKEHVSGIEDCPEPKSVTDTLLSKHIRNEGKTNDTVTCTLGSSGLSLLGQYSSDDDDDDDDDGFSGQVTTDKLAADSSHIITSMDTTETEPTWSGDVSECCGNPVSDLTGQSESMETEETCGNTLVVNRCLDETMATLIRLRLKLESLYEGGLLVYHPGPLVRLIDQCETLYEQ
ncbi:uncharacterized protein LOC132553387 isoform X2 [Ylistrum balloti]|uniref:uncharacterized protein LOC132553387 isoform X2 n=1 Tax=Ylistrum balloti TaxID=509963 RepID=UPI002905AD08|nr:uncharacterized protein LOC132553387 isoform X2 [Ylistrum balloti]